MEHKNFIAAYKVANDNTREVLRTLYPEVDFEGGLKAEQKDNRPVTERIKTFDDACRELGDNHPFVLQYNALRDNGANSVDYVDVVACLKLRIIAAALNEGWEPSFTESEVRWYPWHTLWTKEELANMIEQNKRECAMTSTDDYKTDYCGFGCTTTYFVPSSTNSRVSSRLCFKSHELALYAGRQFIELYADFNLIRK